MIPTASKNVVVNISYIAGGNENHAATLENWLSVSYKLKMYLQYDSVFLFLVIFLRYIKM